MYLIPALHGFKHGHRTPVTGILSYHPCCGDRTRLLRLHSKWESLPYPGIPIDIRPLSSLGAQQLYTAGKTFRERYMQAAPGEGRPETVIYQLSTGEVDPFAVSIISDTTAESAASSEAFMRGLYPPQSSDSSRVPSSFLANGTYVHNPLDGYQYTPKRTPSPGDPDSILFRGGVGCQNFEKYIAAFSDSPDYLDRINQTAQLYRIAGSVLADESFPSQEYMYPLAIQLSEYLSYMNNHNATFHETLSDGKVLDPNILREINYHADELVWAANGNVNKDWSVHGNPISTISGQAFARAVLDDLEANVYTKADQHKFNLFFSDDKPFISFFALDSLAPWHEELFGRPKSGSSMLFELYTPTSLISSGHDLVSYPNSSDLRVRFLFRNGTEGGFTTYPLFNATGGSMAWPEFQTVMGEIAISDALEWCEICSSSKLDVPWCPMAEHSSNRPGSKPSAAVGGVIGAAVTLAFVGVLFAVGVYFGGLRFRRLAKPKTTIKRSRGGFKGGRKMASDTDLRVIKTEGQHEHGHEDPGSVEMRDDMERMDRLNEEGAHWGASDGPVVLPHERV